MSRSERQSCPSTLTGAHEHDIVDHLSYFLAFVNQVEPHLAEEEALLRKHFTKCL
jgi:hypothetical protein